MNIFELKDKTDSLILQYYDSLKKENSTYGEMEQSLKKDLRDLVFEDSLGIPFKKYVESELLILMKKEMSESPITMQKT